MTSDNFARKLSRAQDALSLVQSSSVKTLSSSLGTKWPYKRTMSAPANILTRSDKQGIFTLNLLCINVVILCIQYIACLNGL